jgi:glycerol-3-phosphate dehydrogenase (NAD(P)+)
MSEEAPVRVAIVGAGAWGTALSWAMRRAGCDTILWARDPAVADAINRRHRNPTYLSDIDLDPAIPATSDLRALAGADIGLLALPAQSLREVAGRLRAVVDADAIIVICAKGIELGSGALMAEVVAETLAGHPVAVLSGPTFAAEVARGLPTAVTIASADRRVAADLVEDLGSQTFRPYASDDIIGAEIGGAVKNVIAIACGITEGRGLGENARAALITRGIAEITRLCVAKGGRAETLAGLCGLGDLTLTCTSRTSRNYALGVALGRGEKPADLIARRHTVVEGVATAAAVTALADRLGVEMPIARAVDGVLHRGAAIDETIAALLARRFRAEA